jgi:hypothetical protein
MKQFEITYSDGQIFSGETLSDWNSCPPTGVQNVTVLHDDDSAQERIHGFDYYILDDDNQVIGTDVLVPGSVKEGELIAGSKFILLRDSVFNHSKIWNRPDEGRTFAVGVRQGVVPEE